MAPHPPPELLVDTFREGMLAALGHDLRIEAQRFEIGLTSGALSASVDLGSLRVLGSMRKGGRLDAQGPSASERAEIEQRMQHEILQTARHPRATATAAARAEGEGWVLSGTLELCGRSQPLAARVVRAGDILETSVELSPSRFGIAPFRALGGALRIADRVVVRVRLPLAAAEPPADLAALTARWQRS